MAEDLIEQRRECIKCKRIYPLEPQFFPNEGDIVCAPCEDKEAQMFKTQVCDKYADYCIERNEQLTALRKVEQERDDYCKFLGQVADSLGLTTEGTQTDWMCAMEDAITKLHEERDEARRDAERLQVVVRDGINRCLKESDRPPSTYGPNTWVRQAQSAIDAMHAQRSQKSKS